jgi:17 kDa outer membrane surface antigen
VFALGDREGCRRPLYKGTAASRLCRWLCGLAHRLAYGLSGVIPGLAVVAAVAGALGLCGCSYRLGSLDSKDDSDRLTTGSIAQPAGPGTHASDPSPRAEIDLAYAKATASDVLGHSGGRDSSVPWQNPQTGAGGNITPLETAYSEGGQPCRDFLASYVHAGTQDWLQGAACRTPRGIWEVKRLKSLKSG